MQRVTFRDLILPSGHNYRVGKAGNGHEASWFEKPKCSWNATETKIIQTAMVKSKYFGRSGEVTQSVCLKDLHSQLECEDLEDDDEIQCCLNKEFRSRLLVGVCVCSVI